jgi:homoserine kinase
VKSSVFVPATIGNVGPGFDCFGLCVGNLGDTITIELTNGQSEIVSSEGIDAASIPKDPNRNCTVVAALSMLKMLGDSRQVRVSYKKQIPVSGGLGSSAAASVGGALGALLAVGKPIDRRLVALAALDGEELVAGRHLDNIAPCITGGLSIVRDTKSTDFSALLHIPNWWITVVTPAYRLDTKTARSVLPIDVNRDLMVAQMAHASSLVLAFANNDPQLTSRALHDLYAEPIRSSLLPNFIEAKAAALKAGALGASISGAGPTIFAISETEKIAVGARDQICKIYGTTSVAHTSKIPTEGAHAVAI